MLKKKKLYIYFDFSIRIMKLSRIEQRSYEIYITSYYFIHLCKKVGTGRGGADKIGTSRGWGEKIGIGRRWEEKIEISRVWGERIRIGSGRGR